MIPSETKTFLRGADMAPEQELNEILWHAVKGKDAPMPPAVRRAIAYRPSPR